MDTSVLEAPLETPVLSNIGFIFQLRNTLVMVHLTLNSHLTYFTNVFGKEVN